MKNLLRYVLGLTLFFSIISFRTDSKNLSGIGNYHPDTLRTVSKSISYDDLIFMVDSLLDKDSISLKEIALVEFYSHLIEEHKKSKLTNIPASDFYESFDEQTIFCITPETEFPESQLLVLENDSLGAYAHPHPGKINSHFGWRDNRMHKGVDIDLNKGEPVKAAFDGMVRVARRQGSFGNVIIIRHYNGLETIYAHLSKIKVKPGQVVLSGQAIGLGGNTGRSSGPHLHFEVRFKGQALNPSNLISFENHSLSADTITIRKSRWGITAFPAHSVLHTVQRGDSWYEIAKRYGKSMKEICALNGTDKRYYLKVGQKLRVN